MKNKCCYVFLGFSLLFLYYLLGSGKTNDELPTPFVEHPVLEYKSVPQSQVKNDYMFYDSFDEDLTIEETGDMEDSSSPYWWVNSGAYLFQNDGLGRTLFGELEEGHKWRIRFRNYNASETDDGSHPQNIFRLVLKSKWCDYTQQAEYRIKKYHLSEDSHRAASNGLLLFNRYYDGDNLYYTGLRVDGLAVVKKKKNGKYYTMLKEQVFEGEYDVDENPNLLPVNEWIGLRAVIQSIDEERVQIDVSYRVGKDGSWNEISSVVDDGVSYGGASFMDEGYAGIRTDFMDVEFDNYKIEKNL